MIRPIKLLTRSIICPFFRAKPIDKNNAKDLWRKTKVCCVVSASGIGDAIMATPLIKGIKKCNPNIYLIVISRSPCDQVFDRNPYVNKLLKYNLSIHTLFLALFMLLKLRREKIDTLLAAQPSNTIFHSLISAFSFAKIRLKHEYNYGKSFERDYSFIYHKLLPDDVSRHRVELNLDLLRFLGENIAERSIPPQFYISDNCQKKIDTLLGLNINQAFDNKLIAIHPGGNRENKRLPIERFAEMAETLFKSGFTICLVGGSHEIDLCKTITDLISPISVYNLSGQTTLEETGAALKRCSRLISNDTGIMHLATAIDVHVIAIFGPTNFHHIGPYSDKADIIYDKNNFKNLDTSEIISRIKSIR